jgi:3-hydroxyisobutyrate dehydrogenase-like beta-hydroxyacid dehydrogenase
MKDPIGLIGIGLVGTALAEHLLKADYPVVGFDIVPDKCLSLERMGGKAVSSPCQVATEVKRVFLSLMDTDVVREVVTGPDGILQSSQLPRTLIDTTTGDPEETTRLANLLRSKGIFFLDAPVSGSSDQIRKREGVVMVGGDPKAYEECRDLFQTVARDFFYLGPSGSGSKAKLASNLILGLNRLVLAEGLIFAECLGLDLRAFLSLIKKTPAYSCAMDVKGLKMIEEDFTPQSRISQHHKDLELILRYAEKFGQPLPLGRLHQTILESSIKARDGELDNAAVIRQIRRLGKK